jgi:hypothetical protein
MPTKKIQTGIRLAPSFYGKFKTLADQDCRTVNSLVEKILRQYIDDYERQHGEVTPTVKK